MFNQAHSFSITGSTFVDGNVNNYATERFLKNLRKETLYGASYNSSTRYPPPHCLPGTRLGILNRCLYFIANCSGQNQMRWVVGEAGVGKSAIMQSVADSPELQVVCHASIFFSVQGRDDGTKAITTLCYQLAAKSDSYRQVIENEVSRDPSLLQSSMTVQFGKLIIEPFSRELNSTGRVLIIIDGLDECKNSRTQLELLRLISGFCIKYPSSPLVWLIASRPERHIASFFARANVMPAYEKEEILVDSDDARADVERFLRHTLTKIKEVSELSDPRWPEEPDFRKLANAAGGLFAYAHMFIRYIGDRNIGDPASQLSKVLTLIVNHPMTGIPRNGHPMALLDALYAQSLFDVPDKDARKLILALASGWFKALAPHASNFVSVLYNWLAVRRDEENAVVDLLEFVEAFDKPLIDYVSDSFRSDFSRNIQHEAQQLKSQCALRILQEAPGRIDFGDVDYRMGCGILKRGTGTADRISLAWPGDRNDKETRLILYKMAIGEAVAGIRRGDPAFQGGFYIRLLTSRFEKYDRDFPFDRLHDLLFDESRRRDFKVHGVLEEKPLKMVTISTIFDYVTLQFRPSATTATNFSDPPWNPSSSTSSSCTWGQVRWHRRFAFAACSKDISYDLLTQKIRTQIRKTFEPNIVGIGAELSEILSKR